MGSTCIHSFSNDALIIAYCEHECSELHMDTWLTHTQLRSLYGLCQACDFTYNPLLLFSVKIEKLGIKARNEAMYVSYVPILT